MDAVARHVRVTRVRDALAGLNRQDSADVLRCAAVHNETPMVARDVADEVVAALQEELPDVLDPARARAALEDYRRVRELKLAPMDGAERELFAERDR